MKPLLNEKGSLPLVVLIAFILLISISSLAGLLLSEKMNIRFSIDKDVKRVYERETMIEITKNVVHQRIRTKEWEVIEGEDLLNEADFTLIKKMVNEEALPLAGVEGTVYIDRITSNYAIDAHCQNIGDEENRNYWCLNEPVSILVELVTEKEGEVNTVQFELEGWVFAVSEEKDAVIIRKDAE